MHMLPAFSRESGLKVWDLNPRPLNPLALKVVGIV